MKFRKATPDCRNAYFAWKKFIEETGDTATVSAVAFVAGWNMAIENQKQKEKEKEKK